MTIKDRVQKVKTWFTFLNQYVREMVSWIFGPRHTWLLFIMLAVAFTVIFLFSCREPAIRLVGMALQLVGFGTVAWGLTQARKQFGKPTITGSFAQWLARRPKFGPKHVILGAGFATMPSVISGGRLRTGPRPDASLEERFVMLQRQYEALFDEVGALDTRLAQSKEELSKRIDDEAAARQEADSRNLRQLDEAIVGGLHLDLVGLALFVLGIIAGTASPELSSVLAASCSAL